MKAVLITSDGFFPRALRTLIEPAGWDLLLAPNLPAALDATAPNLCGCLFLHGRAIDARLVDSVHESVRAGFSNTFVIAEEAAAEWEERAYTSGASFVFLLPLRAPLLFGQLNKILPPARPAAPLLAGPNHDAVPQPANPSELAIIRDFGRLLRHANDAGSFVSAYIEHLREVLKVNRVALYVCDPVGGSRLTCAFTTGLDSQISRSVDLSLDVGIGAYARLYGLVLSINGPMPLDPAVRREMDALGATIAIPVRTREQLMGVLLVGPRLMGEPLGRDQVDILFMLMEDLALVLRNARLHSELSRERMFFSAVLEQMRVGLLVFDSGLQVVHVNRTMAACFGTADPTALTFYGLPNPISSLVHSVLQGQSPHAEYDYRSEGDQSLVYHITVEPLQNWAGGKPSVLVLAHNHTHLRAQKEAAVSNAQIAIIGKIGEQFSHIFNNALTPLSVFTQLLLTSAASPQLLKDMQRFLPPTVARLQRHVDQVYFFSRAEASSLPETTELLTLIHDGWQKAAIAVGWDQDLAAASPVKPYRLVMPVVPAALVRVSRPALVMCLFELFLNAMEASSPGSEILVVFDQSHQARIGIGIHDSGSPIEGQVAARIGEAFFTTKSTGLGLGLCVAQKILREHNASFHIGPSNRTKGTACSFVLPVIQ
jgi:signal transduction histidine kinase